MPVSGDWVEHVVPKVADETRLIVDSFAEPPDPTVIEVFTVNGGIDFMCAAGQILVREDQLGRVLDILGLPSGTEGEPVIEGVLLLQLSGGRFDAVVDAVEEINRRIGPGIGTPDQVMTVASGVGSGCSATEPQEVYYEIEPFPSVCHGNGGAGVLIYMADTGLLQDAATHPWLASGVQMQYPVDDLDPLDPGTPPVIPACAGNSGFDRPEFPAAFPGVIGVGALGGDWRGGRRSATSVRGSTCTHREGTSSTPSRRVRTIVMCTRTARITGSRRRPGTSMAWRSGVARRSRRPSSPATSPPRCPAPARTPAERPPRCSPRHDRG